MDKKVYNEFAKWLDNVLSKKMPKDIIAFNFNLYEGEGTFHVQLIGSSSFSEEIESDWACDEVFSTEENIFIIDRKFAGLKWEEGLSFSKEMVINYLENGKYSNILKAKEAVAIGFVDGDIDVLYKK